MADRDDAVEHTMKKKDFQKQVRIATEKRQGDEAPETRKLDAVTGEAAVVRVEPMLRQLPADDVTPPNMDPQQCAIAALAVVDRLREPARAAIFATLPEAVLERGLTDRLEQLAHALWYIHTEAKTDVATQTGVKVDMNLVNEGVALRERMLQVLGYHFSDDEKMVAEVADIRAGTGYQDLATDLSRLNRHYEEHADALARDKRHYQPSDAARAGVIRDAIVSALRSAMNAKASDAVDLKHRAFTMLLTTYDALKAANDFVYRTQPNELAAIPTLRGKVVSITGKRNAPAETQPSDGSAPAKATDGIKPLAASVAEP